MSKYIERPRYQCALGGALVTINSINRAAAIVHAAPGCASSADGAATVGSGYWGAGYCGGRAIPSSNILEKEIVFGGENRLQEQIENTLSIIDADLFAVITGCMTDIIGDDVKAVVSEFQKQGKPVVVAETGGFKGDSTKGYDFILEAFITQYVEKGLPKNPRLVNLIGVIPTQDVFWRGNLIELKRVLTDLGLEVNTFFTPLDNLESLKGSSQAALNIVLSDVHGIRAAQIFEEVHGTPFISTPLPIGPTATKEFLGQVANQLGVAESRLNQVIEEESAWYYRFAEHLADIYNDLDLQRYGVIVGNSDYSYALTKFLIDDLGWIPYFVAITDNLDEEEQVKVLERFATIALDLRPKVIFETDTSRIGERLNEELAGDPDEYSSSITPAFLLGSTLDRTLAVELKAGFHSVTYPITNRVVTDQAYTGYRGGLRLVTEILSALLSNR